MDRSLNLPVGIDEFKKIRESNFYYVDKTMLIEHLMNKRGEVNLFTRPRRFGKTLNMSMLKSFFEIGADKTLFDGLYISHNNELCDAHMGKYPVIFLSLKGVEGLAYENAEAMFKWIVGSEASRFSFLEESDKLTEGEREQYREITAIRGGKYSMDRDVLASSLKVLSQLLYKHYDQKTVILIDEYDVPLDKAFQNGFYSEMVSLVRGILGNALKTNEFLQFAVLTGCLRVSKESIFTGLNNFEINSIVDVNHDEEFGFTDDEVKKLLSDYSLSGHYDVIKEWYDGYRFGNADIYCPWDVINYAKKLLSDPEAEPQAFWINTSGNDLVKRFVDKADRTTREEIEKLVTGEVIEKKIRLDLTYDEIDNSIDHLWSVLFTTGYLTMTERPTGGVYKLVIPNREVREVFVLQIQEWFKQTVISDRKPMNELCQAFADGDAESVQKQLTIILGKMISVLDTKARDEYKESFYHGLLLGLLRSEPEWLIRSNRESGEGFSDITVLPEDPDAGIVIEVKYSASIRGLDKACEKAMVQIKERRYDNALREDGREDILAYGIAFCRKRCRVVCERL